MPQSGQFQQPAKPERIPGFPENFQYIVFDGFKGLNTKPTRPAIEDQQMFWCDNWFPLGENNLRTMWDHGEILFNSLGITTWNPADLFSIRLSNGNLTAAAASSATIGAVRATTKKLTSKHYFECVHQVVSSGNNTVGVANGTATESNYVGSDVNGYGVRPNGDLYHNGVIVATVASYNIGDVVGIAVDCDAKLAWWRTNTGNWNNNVSANPATGVGGIDVSALTEFYPMVSAIVVPNI